MGGCCVVVLMMILIPLLIVGLVIFLGIVGGALVTMLLSGVLLSIGISSGLFQRFLESEVAWIPALCEYRSIKNMLEIEKKVTGHNPVTKRSKTHTLNLTPNPWGHFNCEELLCFYFCNG